MSVETLTAIRLGYGGGATFNGTRVPVTAGNMDNSVSVQHQSAYLMPNNTTSRSRILHSDGTVTHTGNISFDLTNDALSSVKDILKRGQTFDVSLYDGVYGRSMTDCYATSISLSGSPAGLITATIAFMSTNPATKTTNVGNTNYSDIFSTDFIPYWWSGNSYVRDWTFTFNQSVTPKFSNLNLYKMTNEGVLASSPNYLFIGEIDCSLDFTTFCPLVSDKVYIANSSFKINGRTNSTGYTMGSFNDLATHKYNIMSHALGKNDSAMLTIL